MSKKVVGFDVDGVLRNFNSMLTQMHNAELGIEHVDKWVHPDFECAEYSLFDNEKSCYDLPALNKVWQQYPFQIMRYAKPYEGYKEFIDSIYDSVDYISDRVKFITHQYTEEAKQATELWCVEHNLVDIEHIGTDLIFEHGDHKYNHCDVLIDDKLENLYQCIDHGHELAFCMARAWNTKINPKYKSKIIRGDYDLIAHVIDGYLQ